MHVLQLVTNEDAPFFRQQVELLEQHGITSDVRSPAGERSGSESRSVMDYLSFGSGVYRDSLAEYDLIHANYGLTAPPAVFGSDLPVVLSLWGSDLLGHFGSLSRLSARFADEVIVMSTEMATAVPRQTHVIPHGIDLSLFQPMAQARARSAVEWEQTGVHILFPYSPHRTVKDFPRAARIVAAVERRISEPVHLHTLSNIAHEEMPNYYNAADVVLIPSKREGSPNTVREALACNRPVVATAVGDIPDQLRGLPVSSACETDSELVEAVLTALETDQQPAGRSRAAETSAEAMAAQIKAVYELAQSAEDYTTEQVLDGTVESV